MTNRTIYKYGLYGRCPICKEISQETCSLCGEKDYFADSGKPGHVLCTKCNTLNKITCDNEGCNQHLKVIRTPKNIDEKNRIDEFIKRKKEHKKDSRDYTIKSRIDSEKETPTQDKKENERTEKDKKEMELIKEFWGKKKNNKKTTTEQTTNNDSKHKDSNERRIVNQFYEEHEDEYIDKKINFEDEFNEEVYFDCNICGTTENQIVCDKCGSKNKFSLNYDALNCACGNKINIVNCDCGAKQGHNEFYLISDNVKWQYSQTRSYYNYRKGRMLVFSTCPSCGLFSVEKCKECGSKVNFGKPNKNNEIYCKNCGTINQFTCENPSCDNTIKHLKNPTSIEENLEWLNEVMNVKVMAAKKKKRKIEERKKENRDKTMQTVPVEKEKITIGDSRQTTKEVLEDSSPNFTSSFIETIEEKNKNIITESFISEIKEDVLKEKELKKEIRQHNRQQSENKKEEIKKDYTQETFYGGSKSGGKKIFITIIIAITIAICGYLGYMYFMKNQTPIQIYNNLKGQPTIATEIKQEQGTTKVKPDSADIILKQDSDSLKTTSQDSLKKEKISEPKGKKVK